MINYIFILIAIIFGWAIISNTGITRLYWFFAGIILFPNSIILFTFPVSMPFHRYLIYILLISELFRFTDFKNQFASFPLKKIFIIVLIGTFIIGIFDPRLNLFLKLYRPTFIYLETFFVLFLCYCSIDSSIDWIKLKNLLIALSILICTYGIFNFITKSNPYDNIISTTYNTTSYFNEYALMDGRFRINSTASHPIYYGFLLGLLIIFNMAFYYRNRRFSTITIFSLFLLMTNLLMTNSRTPILTFILGLITLSYFSLSLKKKLHNTLLLSLLLFASYSFIPLMQEKINDSLDIFKTGGTKTSGSNMELRYTQLLASLDQFNKSPVRGNGFSYIEENLGWSDKKKAIESETDFAGFESYIYQLLIEQGLIGIFISFIFFFSIYRYFIRGLVIYKLISGFGIAVISMFLLFSLGTGTLGSWIITMALTGVAIKSIELQRFNILQVEYILKNEFSYLSI